MNFLSRFPSSRQLAPVYGVIVAVIYSWSLLRFFWRLPSFMFYSTAGEIGVTYAYLTVVNFFESILILLVPIALSLVLPKKWFYDRFVTKGVLLVSLGLAYLAYIAKHIVAEAPFPYALVKWSPLVALVILILVFLLDRIKFLTNMLAVVSDRFVIFLYISIPVSVVSLLVVLVRNIM